MLACSDCFLIVPRDGTTHSQPGPPTVTRNYTTDFPTGKAYGGHFLNKEFSSKMTLLARKRDAEVLWHEYSIYGTGERAQWLMVLAAFPGDLSLNPRSYIRWLTVTCNSSFLEAHISGFHGHQWSLYTDTRVHISKNNKKILNDLIF